MTNQAVAERTDASTQGETSEETQADELGTDLNEGTKPQSATDAGSENTESSEEDEGARLTREANEAEIDRRADEKAQSILAEAKAKEVESTRQAAAKARTGEINLVTGGFGNVIKDMRAELAKAGVVDSDEQDAILSPLEGHNGKLKPLFQKLYDNATLDVSEAVSSWLIEATPEANRPAVKEAVDADKKLTEVLPMVVEALALSSDAVKKAKPEDLIEANKALKAKVTGDLANETLRVRKGIRDGTIKPYPDSDPDGKPSNPADNMTYARLNSLPESEKSAWIKKNPDKFGAFIGTGKT